MQLYDGRMVTAIHSLNPRKTDATAARSGIRISVIGQALICYGLAERLREAIPAATLTNHPTRAQIPEDAPSSELIVFVPAFDSIESELNEFRASARTRPTIVAVPAATRPDLLLSILHANVRVLVEAESSVDCWRQALTAAANGACWMTDAARKALLARAFPADFVEPEKLFSGIRRQQILRMYLQGRSRHEMATELGISAKTVSGYLTSIRRHSAFRQQFSEGVGLRVARPI